MQNLPDDEQYRWDGPANKWAVIKYDYGTGQWSFKQWMPRGWQPSQPAVVGSGAKEHQQEDQTSNLPHAHYRQRVDSVASRGFASAATASSAGGYLLTDTSRTVLPSRPGGTSPIQSSVGQWTASSYPAAIHPPALPAWSHTTGGTSVQGISYQGRGSMPRTHSQRRTLPRGRGENIEGTYRGPDTLHYELVDQSYFVRSADFFSEGRVFAVIMNETAGSTTKPTDYNTSRSINAVVYQDNYVHTQTRRFVVVRHRPEFCFACPIFTYSGQATTKRGVRAGEHGVAYSWGNSPQLLQGESGITKSSIGVVMTANAPNLDPASRIYYGIHHPIQYNVKVKEIGYVPANHLPTLIGNWREEDENEMQQSSSLRQGAEFSPSTSQSTPDYYLQGSFQAHNHQTPQIREEPSDSSSDGEVEGEDDDYEAQ